MSNRKERDLEREQIEWVFGLTGGELADEPWTVLGAPIHFFRHDPLQTEAMDEHVFPYWYEGVPDYSEIRDKYSETYRTVVVDEMGGPVPGALLDKEGGIWKKIRSFRNSGETECPGRQDEGVVTESSASNGKYCDYCEANIGEDHGYIYLGDGWGEVIYQLHKPRYLEDEEAPRRESHQRTALTRRTRTPMQEHGRPVDYARRYKAVSGYTIEERGAQWQRREPGGRYYIGIAHGEDRMFTGDYTLHDKVPGKYETEAEAEVVARSLFPNAKRVRY